MTLLSNVETRHELSAVHIHFRGEISRSSYSNEIVHASPGLLHSKSSCDVQTYYMYIYSAP